MSEQPPQPDVGRVLSGLDSEIQRVKDNDTRPGWSHWASLVAAATLLWIAADSLNDFRPRGIRWIDIQLFLTFCLFVDVVNFLPGNFPRRSSTDTKLQYRPVSEVFNAHVSTAFLRLIRALLIIAAAIWLSDGFARVWTVVLPYGLYAAMALVITVAGMFNVWVPPGDPDRLPARFAFYIGGAVLVIPTVIAVLIHAQVSWNMWVGGVAELADVRLASATVAAVFVLMRMPAGSRSQSALEALYSTRRDLAFGRIDANTALRQIDIVLVGYRLADIVQEELSKVISLLSEMRGEMAREREDLDAASQILARDPAHLTATDTKAVLALIASSAARKRRETALIEEADELHARLHRRLRFLVTTKTQSDASELNNQVKVVLNDVEADLGELRQKYSTFQLRLQELRPPATNAAAVDTDGELP